MLIVAFSIQQIITNLFLLTPIHLSDFKRTITSRLIHKYILMKCRGNILFDDWWYLSSHNGAIPRALNLQSLSNLLPLSL